jgi:hypothetical protein
MTLSNIPSGLWPHFQEYGVITSSRRKSLSDKKQATLVLTLRSCLR